MSLKWSCFKLDVNAFYVNLTLTPLGSSYYFVQFDLWQKKDLPDCLFQGSKFGSRGRDILWFFWFSVNFSCRHGAGDNHWHAVAKLTITCVFICFRRQSHNLLLDLKSAANLSIWTSALRRGRFSLIQLVLPSFINSPLAKQAGLIRTKRCVESIYSDWLHLRRLSSSSGSRTSYCNRLL